MNTKQKLYFVVPKGDYKILKKIEKCKPKNQLDQLPKPGTWSLFHHEARNKFYRAFVLSTNRGDDARALFLYDTGEVLYGQFKKEQFFFVPDHIDHFSAFALFVKIEVPFNPDASIPPVKLEAMRECFLKFTVLKNTQFSKEKMIFNIESRCVVLRLNDADRPKSDSDDDDSSDASATVRNMYSQKRATFTLDDLPKLDTGNIKAGSIVLVYPSKFRADDKSIYVNIASIVDCSDLCLFKKIIHAGFALRIWLNKTLVCQFIRTLDESPKTNEMVIALVDESRYYERAVVQRVHSDGKNAEVSETKGSSWFIIYLNSSKIFRRSFSSILAARSK